MVYLCMLTAYMCIFCYIVGILRKYLMCISALFILGFCVLFASKIPCILMHISVMQKVLFFSAYSWVFRHGVCVIHAYLRRLVLQMSVYIRRRYFYTYYNLYSLFFCVLKACDLYISAFFSYKTHDVTDHQLTIGNFMPAIASMGSQKGLISLKVTPIH